jgi:hypothetical protein
MTETPLIERRPSISMTMLTHSFLTYRLALLYHSDDFPIDRKIITREDEDRFMRFTRLGE